MSLLEWGGSPTPPAALWNSPTSPPPPPRELWSVPRSRVGGALSGSAHWLGLYSAENGGVDWSDALPIKRTEGCLRANWPR